MRGKRGGSRHGGGSSAAVQTSNTIEQTVESEDESEEEEEEAAISLAKDQLPASDVLGFRGFSDTLAVSILMK